MGLQCFSMWLLNWEPFKKKYINECVTLNHFLIIVVMASFLHVGLPSNWGFPPCVVFVLLTIKFTSSE
jgi:hypothetical protein